VTAADRQPPTGAMVRISTDVVVIGGSIAGLATALFAARRGLRVTVVDGDDRARPEAFDETVGRSPRWTTPQAAHSHAFLARAFTILQEEAPDILAELVNAGVRTMALTPPPPSEGRGDPLTEAVAPADDTLQVLLSRRTTFEAVLRDAASSRPSVDYHWGRSVSGLRIEAGDVPHVTGVTLDDGTVVAAEVVIDATGRRGEVHDWLVEAGIDVDETDTDCGIAYHSRFYRLLMGQAGAGLNRGYTAGSSFDRYSCLVFPGDNDTFSVTFGVLPEDRQLKGLRKEAGFQAAAEQIEVVRDWVDPARSQPISPVSSMMRMRNRIRRLQRDGIPTVTGIAPIADAAGISNPAHSRGCSLALWHAQRVVDALVGARGDRLAFAVARDEALEATLAPWVEDSRAQDAARLSRWRPDAGASPSVGVPADQITNGEAYVAAQHDPIVWHAFTRLQQLLAQPGEVLADPAIVARVREVQARGLGLPPLDAPSHDDLADLVDRANAAPARQDVSAGIGNR
jgi:2-polyprenyl-6-methoxyphenol hydroxylase-like FAD-dependent oxidoreductase